jgi:thiamine-phosphate pyrophosphorylase
VVGDCVDAGLQMIQLREKDLPRPELLDLGRRLQEVSRGRAQLFINGDLDVARGIGAEGIHLPQDRLQLAPLATGLAVGVSVHDAPSALEGERVGARFLIFGPVSDTPSKRQYGPPQGLDALAKIAAAVRIPVLAIGGITPERVVDVRHAGATGVGVISALLSADAPADAVRRFLDALASTR